jgi:sortase A
LLIGERRDVHTRATIERALLVLGVVLLTIYVGARIQSTVLARLALRSFEASRTASLLAEKPERKLGSSRVNFSLWSEPRIDAYERSLAQHFLPPLAVLQVASIDLEVPVLDGTDDLTLNRGAGWIRGTARPRDRGNVGIAGHRDGFFRGLKDLKMGDTMDLVTHDRTDTYVVDGTRVVSPDDVSVLRPDVTPSLTLVTCYPFYFVGSAPQRYIVHASIVRSQSPNTGTRGEGNSAMLRVNN